MKRSGWALVAGALMVSAGLETAAAQERPFELGFRFGLGVGMQSVDPGETDGSRVGITAGGIVGFPVAPNVAVETGLLYELRGAKYASSFEFGVSYARPMPRVRVPIHEKSPPPSLKVTVQTWTPPSKNVL